ncbi:RlmE family RNA methyltransferase [[Eubacterium] cellulosolvens]
MRGRSHRTWLKKRRRDQFYRRAKTEGFRSRSAFKLREIAQKKRFLKPSVKVVDLGAAPGGWLQVIHEFIGETGTIVGVDITPIKPLGYKNLTFILTNVENPDLPELINHIGGGKVDVILSDISPNISGVWELDHARQISYAKRALQISTSILKEGGTFFVKVFQGSDLRPYYTTLKRYFNKVSYEKPKASRPSSSEVYILALGFKGTPKEDLRHID